jgi:hypothetical protein
MSFLIKFNPVKNFKMKINIKGIFESIFFFLFEGPLYLLTNSLVIQILEYLLKKKKF